MSSGPIQQARDTYNIAHWGDGYFDINEKGHVVAYPDGDRTKSGIDLALLIKEIRQAGLSLPILVRFTDILKHRLRALQQAFAVAMHEQDYKGGYLSVYPIKVNQQRRVVETLLGHGGRSMGLEAGSKPELLAVLALSAQPDSVVICNGYKDREYIRLALIGQQLGHRVYIIIEKLSELDLVLEESAKLDVMPVVGVRVRLASIGAGKWQNTGGEKSKFGLTATQVLQVVERLRASKQLSSLQLIHCHLGSQIANIRDIQRGMSECARFFAELCQLGVPINCVDVGGGLGVDYEGTRSRSFCSMNYSVQEYANNVVDVLKQMCDEKKLPHPQVITESGRALTAHHAMLILNIIDAEKTAVSLPTCPTDASSPRVIQALWQAIQHLNERSVLEVYHEATHGLVEAQNLFTHGLVSLAERAQAEQMYTAICLKIRDLLQPQHKAHREIIDELNEKLADKLIANFSLFQSLPDIWAIEQIFPLMPLSHLNEPLTARGVLQDMTCDSDGRIDYYVDGQDLQTTLPLPPYHEENPYCLGVFLVGAYQEILGDMHNLFGDTDSVHVELTDNGYRLEEPVRGDTVADVLRYVHFEKTALLLSYRKQLAETNLSPVQRENYFTELQAGLNGYTYLEE
jgi:arginine decarboxylase